MQTPQTSSRTVATFAPSAVKLSHRSRTTLFLSCALALLAFNTAATAQSRPILVELFTSEGCSDCPPADALLAKIAGERKDVIVLSEHVDYWNYLGWSDPFSSAASTQRQQDYAQRFRGEGPYTPQMVVDGTRQFVGSNSSALHTALAASADKAKPALTLTSLYESSGRNRALGVSIKLAETPARARLIAVLVQNEGHQDVKRGENGGRTLRHISIAREFHDLGETSASHPTATATEFKLPDNADPTGYHIVVFVQQGAGGAVLAAATT